MKLAYIVPSLAQRGPVLVVFHLVQEMLAHGHECTVYYFDNIIELKFPCKTERIFFLSLLIFRLMILCILMAYVQMLISFA